MDSKVLEFNSGFILKSKSEHIPSTVQPDTLFTFTDKLEYLLPWISSAMIPPRYCVEDISYLHIPNFKKLAYPMKCFCDINLHRLGEHLGWYGNYGIAFSKEWGMRNRIQPVQYINPDSELCKDFAASFSEALNIDASTQSKQTLILKDFLLHELMYYKPYSGTIKRRTSDTEEEKCFTDECEWRYIPNVTALGYQQVYRDGNILNTGILSDINNSMSGRKEISLTFTYGDIKYIIVKDISDLNIIIENINRLEIEDIQKYHLVSKIIVWEQSKGDF